MKLDKMTKEELLKLKKELEAKLKAVDNELRKKVLSKR
jgi:hypothetical protein